METKIKELRTAQGNVLWLLEHGEGLVDMHGIAYWAGVVERLREEIKSNL